MSAKLDPLNGKIRESQSLIENRSQYQLAVSMGKFMPFIYPMLYFHLDKIIFYPRQNYISKKKLEHNYIYVIISTNHF